MKRLNDIFTKDIQTAVIAGHVNPDGDCVGSATALLGYVRRNYPWIDVSLYLERPKEALMFLPGLCEEVFTEPAMRSVDLFVTCDVSTKDRIAAAGALFDAAGKTVSIDHHASNPLFADVNIVDGEAGSCAEVLFTLFEEEKISRDIAISLYTGIIHDTGVFQYSNVRPSTLRIAATLLEKGVPAAKIIDESFNERTLVQNRVLGYVLAREKTFMEGRIAAGCISLEEMRQYGAEKKDLDPIVASLRLTAGAECAVFVYETEPGTSKVSLRSSSETDVAKVAALFGGGGHTKAAGCTVQGKPEEVLVLLTEALGKEMNADD